MTPLPALHYDRSGSQTPTASDVSSVHSRCKFSGAQKSALSRPGDLAWKQVEGLMADVRKLRRTAHSLQGGHCYYCHEPVWEEDPALFALQNNVPQRLLVHVRCTAEHLQARQDGGRNSRENIVAACAWCNSQRHKGRQRSAPTAKSYALWVQTIVRSGKWHPVVTHRAAMQEKSRTRRLSARELRHPR